MPGDGRRANLTNSLCGARDDPYEPDGVGAWTAKLDVGPDGGIAADPRFFPHGDDLSGLRVHQTRL